MPERPYFHAPLPIPILQCEDRTCISDVSVCDEMKECAKRDDEAECGCDVITISSHTQSIQ